MKNKRLETYQEMKNLEKACKITKEEVWSERESVLKPRFWGFSKLMSYF